MAAEMLNWWFGCFLMFGIPTQFSKVFSETQDRLCIAQHDVALKERGIRGLGCFLAKSQNLTILWSGRYFSRLSLVGWRRCPHFRSLKIICILIILYIIYILWCIKLWYMHIGCLFGFVLMPIVLRWPLMPQVVPLRTSFVPQKWKAPREATHSDFAGAFVCLGETTSGCESSRGMYIQIWSFFVFLMSCGQYKLYGHVWLVDMTGYTRSWMS